MTQDSVLVTYVVTGFSHGDLTNALGNGLPEADYDTVVGTYAISDTDLVYYNGGHEFVEIIKIEPLFIFEKKLRIPPSPNLPNYLAISLYPSMFCFFVLVPYIYLLNIVHQHHLLVYDLIFLKLTQFFLSHF